MRIVLLLAAAVAIGIAAKQSLTTSVPAVAPQPGQPASREALQKFGQDVQNMTNAAAAERARQAEEATR